MWARLAAASQELLEEGERLQAENDGCSDGDSSSSDCDRLGDTPEPGGSAAVSALQSIRDAGFSEADALESLKLCDNDPIAAVNFLLDARSSSSSSALQSEWLDHSDAAAQDYVDGVTDKFMQLCPWLTSDKAAEECHNDYSYYDSSDGDGSCTGTSDHVSEERFLGRFQGPIQMADGSFYDGSVHDSGGSSVEFPSLDSSNFPALPSSNHHTGTRCRPQEQPQERRDSNEPIILEFARLPRAHRLQAPPRLDTSVAQRMIKHSLPRSQLLQHEISSLPVPSTLADPSIIASRVSTGDAVASLFASARDEAISHAQQRNALFAEATAAYRAGDGARAKALGEKGRWHNAQMQQLHSNAMSSIFAQRNAGLQGSVIDLHGLHVAEALQVIQARLDSGSKEPFTLITGSGKHSQGQQARLLPHVLQALKDYNCRATQPVWGQVHVLPR